MVPVLTRSDLLPADLQERARSFTRILEFNYVAWTIDALEVKIAQAAQTSSEYLSAGEQHQVVLDYLKLLRQSFSLQTQISEVYANPDIQDPGFNTASLRDQQDGITRQLKVVGAYAESVLQSQVNAVASQLGLGLGGQPFPPVLYHTTPLPFALIISPRSVIRSDVDISLIPDLSVDQMVTLENAIGKRLDVSALVVSVGGIGIYPTMVEQTDDLTWLSETISHEWTHNFLTLRPLGLSYETSPELRTMNETTASIAGTEIGGEVIRRYYPELVPEPEVSTSSPTTSQPPSKPTFDFRVEMHTTRIEVDRLLSLGEITEAEKYMEARRRIFFEHGYIIRKLNQAYFAFYGAYADQPGGAAGEDPVGPAVRSLRARSSSLASFLYRIGSMTSFAQLQAALH